MSLPVSRIVDVTITQTQAISAQEGFGLLNIVGISDIIPIGERYRTYETIDAVAVDFAITDEEYLAALVYFSQNPRPSEVMISRRASTDLPALLRCGLNVNTTIATWAATADWEFAITINSIQADVTAIDGTGITTMALMAAEIETQLQAADANVAFTAATVEWTGTRFLIRSGVDGDGPITIMSAVSGGVGTDMVTMADGGSGAIAYAGVDTETITESLDAINVANGNWYGLAFTAEVNDVDASILLASIWCEARLRLFAVTTSDANTLDAAATSDLAYQLEQGEYRRTFCSYSSTEDYIGVAVFGILSVVNFDGTDTTITLKFKQLATITAESLNSAQASAAEGKNCNYYNPTGANNMFAQGVCSDGSFIDSVHGTDWLQGDIEDRVFALLASTNKVPLTDKGAGQIGQQLTKSLDQGVTNGFLAPGELSDGTELPEGYLITYQKVADMTAAAKALRQGPVISFIAIDASAIHSVVINGTITI